MHYKSNPESLRVNSKVETDRTCSKELLARQRCRPYFNCADVEVARVYFHAKAQRLVVGHRSSERGWQEHLDDWQTIGGSLDKLVLPLLQRERVYESR